MICAPVNVRTRSKATSPLNAEPRSTYHHGDLRNALISAGQALLEEVGPQEFSLREAARRIGVSIAAPSRHFDGKEALLAAIAVSGFRELAAERLVIAKSRSNELSKAKQMMYRYVDFARRSKGLFNLMVGPVIIQRGAYPELVEASDASFNLFAMSVSDYARTHGWDERDLNLLIHAAWAVEHGIAMLIIGGRIPRQDRPVDIDDAVKFSVSIVFSAIAAGPKALRAVLK